jgi:eukaryotic-like serine/threonine-protein kinase
MERVKAIYDYAVDLQPEERESFLRQISSEDPELLQQVRRMLDQATADTQEIAPTPIGSSTAPAHRYIFSSGDLIAGRYRVLRKVAKGGMGEVYEVHDLELHSRVALKVISLKSAAKPNSAEMFRREILLARQVTHPNVCRIYDIGRHEHPDHGELLFLTMEFLEGTTLADYVRTQGPVSKEDALPLIQQMIHALAAAHRLNIAHRDFKSGNVILCEAKGASGSDRLSAPSDAVSSRPGSPQFGAAPGSTADQTSDSGSSGKSAADSGAPNKSPVSGSPSSSSNEPSHKVIVKVTDFGLARSVDGMETTLHGEVWGTPDYMAPEQFHGQSSIASDIYALGVVIYEMFTAKLPHRSSTATGTPDGKPSAAMEMIPAEWRPVVKKCMAYDPTDRYATVEDVWAALNGDEDSQRLKRGISRRVSWGWASAVLVVLGLSGWLGRDAIRRWFNPVPEQKHIAVLQFENLGDDAANKAFAAGVGETLASRLSQLGTDGQLYWVVPFSDSRKYADVEQARRNLDVTLVVTGTVQRTGDAVRMTVNVIDAKKHKQLASRVMTASMADLNLLQDEAWESVADMVQQPVDPGTKKTLDDSSTKNSRAYEYYEQGVGYLQRGDPASVDNAIDAFKKSAAEDPNYALAQAGLGGAYATKYADTKDSQLITAANEHGNRAVALNPDLAPVRETLGKIYEYSGKWDQALAEYRRAVELNPVSVIAPYHIARIYARQGKYTDAEESYKRMIARMPSFWLGYTGLGELYFNLGRFNDAALQYQKVIELMPSNPLGYEGLGAAYEQMGEYQKAITVFNKGLTVSPSAEIWSDLGAAYMFAGENSKAAQAMQKAVERNPHDHMLWRNLADSYRQVPSLANRANETYQKALDTAQQRLAVNPQDAYALSGMALYEAHLGRKPEALAYIDKTLALAPKDGTVLFTVALAYEIIGDRSHALSTLDRSLSSGFSLEDVKREPELQALRSDRRYQQMLSKTKVRS